MIGRFRRTRGRLSDVEDRVIFGTIATIASAFVVAFALTGYPVVADYSRVLDAGGSPDILHERATGWEALFGDTHRPISEIMEEHGHPGFGGGWAPRAPGAYMLQLPLLLIPESWLMTTATTLILIGAFSALRLTHLISGVEWRRMIWVGPVLYISLPVVTAISYGSLPVMLAMILVLTSWAFRERSWAGVPLGLAAASRLWPGLIIIGFWLSGRRRAAYQATLVSFGATMAGLLLPGVTVSGTIDGLLDGAVDYFNHNQNASLSLVVARFGVPPVVSVAVGAALGLWLAIRNRPQAISITAVAALLASPLSWPTYTLVAMPAGASWWRRGRTLAIGLLASSLVLWFLIPPRWIGHLVFGSLLVLLLLVSRIDLPSQHGEVEGLRDDL